MQTWSFFPQENRLKTQDEVAHLTGKASSILEVLASRPGEVVTRDEILKSVWKDVHVTADLVREYIFDLRQALGDDASNPTYIETIRGKGFRLVGGIHIARHRAQEPGTLQRPRIAVLRPDVLEGGSVWQRFTDGLADELITDLARFGDIAVVSRVSSFAIDKRQPIEKITEALGCDYFVESSFSVWNDHLKAQFQLIDVRTGLHAWAEGYERDTAWLPGLSSEVALTVANELTSFTGAIQRAERRYAGRRPPSELTAYENYVVAVGLEERFDTDSQNQALAHINQSIALDPNFARSHLVHAMLCDRGTAFPSEIGDDEWFALAHASAETALGLDQRDPLIMAFNGRTCAALGRTAKARHVATRAADFARNESIAALHAASNMTLVLGAFNVADELLDVAYKLSPIPPDFFSFFRGRNLLLSGRAEEAEALSLTGPEFQSTFVIRCLAQSLLGKREEALKVHQRILADNPKFLFETYPKAIGLVSEDALATFDEAVSGLGL